MRTENFEADYARQLDETSKGYESRRQGIAAEAAARAKREWLLTKPLAEYEGKYVNDMAGTIEIAAKDKALSVRMGNLFTVSTPYTQPDTIRVVMLPGGNGEVIAFAKDAEGKIGSLNLGGVIFTRVVK